MSSTRDERQRRGLFFNGLQLLLGLALVLMLPGCTGIVGSGNGENITATPQAGNPEQELTSNVNPFIGTAPAPSAHSGFAFNTGDVFPDATYPMGMVQWGPDTATPIPGHYYYPDNTIQGFSLTHFSGRGCPAWGDFPFMPYIGNAATPSSFSHNAETAHPGYYKVQLAQSNISVELTAAAHSGVGMFTFPVSKTASVLINAGGSVRGNQNALVQINKVNNEITGQTTSIVGCGLNKYTLYISAQFDHTFSQASGNGTAAARLTFNTTTDPVVQVEVGISFVSIANARLNRLQEVGNGNFSSVSTTTNAAWNTRLNTIQVQGGSQDERTNFYTAMYHVFIHPNVFSDVNGQYLGFDNKVHLLADGQHAQYENIPGWDENRSLTRLRAILAPIEASDLAQSLVNDAQQGDGHLPRWEQANIDSHGMNGDSADIEIADIYAYGGTHFDTQGALTAMLEGQNKVREGYSDYTKFGYVAATTAADSVAITQEYTNDDFAIAQFAQALGKTAISQQYLKRADNWRKILNPSSGYVQPRNLDGSWSANFSPTNGRGFQETDAAQATWMETFNLRGLFNVLGGDARVVKRLDRLFQKLNDGTNSQNAYMGNEPSLLTPWEYDFAGAPAHTQRVIRRIQTELFTNTPGGLPGNDDGGTMSAWYVFSALGLYPEIPGVGGLVIGSPLFPAARVELGTGQSLQINAPAATVGTPYVQELKLDGKVTTSTWLPWNTVKNGATLDFSLGDKATNWGSGSGDAPPSFSANAA